MDSEDPSSQHVLELVMSYYPTLCTQMIEQVVDEELTDEQDQPVPITMTEQTILAYVDNGGDYKYVLPSHILAACRQGNADNLGRILQSVQPERLHNVITQIIEGNYIGHTTSHEVIRELIHHTSKDHDEHVDELCLRIAEDAKSKSQMDKLLSTIRETWYRLYPDWRLTHLDVFSSISDGTYQHVSVLHIDNPDHLYFIDIYARYAIRHRRQEALDRILQGQSLMFENPFQRTKIRAWIEFALKKNNSEAVSKLYPCITKRGPLFTTALGSANTQREFTRRRYYSNRWTTSTMVCASRSLPCFSSHFISPLWYSDGKRIQVGKRQNWCIPGYTLEIYNDYIECLTTHLIDDVCALIIKYVTFDLTDVSMYKRNYCASICHVLSALMQQESDVVESPFYDVCAVVLKCLDL
jgi:hypothetical protein